MKRKKLVLIAFALTLLASCKNTTNTETLTVADYENATKHFSTHMNQFVYNTVNGSWADNHTFIYQKKIKDGTTFIKVDAQTKEKKPAFDHEKLATALSNIIEGDITATSLPFNNFTLSDQNRITFYIKGKQYQCSLEDYEVTEITENINIANRYEYIAPNGKIAAYIDNHNLWIRNMETNKKTQLTFDGIEDYGYATNNAGWVKSKDPVLKWSPNSDKIATFQQDARGVGEMYLTSTNVGHPKLEAWKHPLPG